MIHMIHLTPTEIILAITCAAIILWLYIYGPKLINRLPKFQVEGTREQREQDYINACWEEIEGKRRKEANAPKKKGKKRKKIVKMKKRPGEYVIPVMVVLILLNMIIYGLLN